MQISKKKMYLRNNTELTVISVGYSKAIKEEFTISGESSDENFLQVRLTREEAIRAITYWSKYLNIETIPGRETIEN